MPIVPFGVSQNGNPGVRVFTAGEHQAVPFQPHSPLPAPELKARTQVFALQLMYFASSSLRALH